MKLFTQSATLLFSMLLVLLIVSTPLAGYIAPILGIVIVFSVIFIVIKQRALGKAQEKTRREDIFTGSNKEVFMVVLAIMLAVFLTGGLTSNLLFLTYFLIFGIVFLFEPATVFVLLLGLLVVFYQSIFDGDMVSNLIKLGSLVLLSPISYFFGREFARREALEREIEDKTGQIIEDAQVLRSKKQSDEEIEEIDDIIEKSQELRSQ